VAADLLVPAIVTTVGGGFFGWLRHRERHRAEVRIAEIGREAAEREAATLRAQVVELQEDLLELRGQVAELRRMNMPTPIAGQQVPTTPET
jgi:hypothetical protein